jgi:two-component system sporulation sensor kinase B
LVGLDYLLLNFLFVFVSVLAFFSSGLHKKKFSNYVFGAICGMDVIFCMTFPFTVIPGYMYDLRIVPFLISILYGGIRSGCLVAAVLILYRYYLGGDGFEVTIYSYIPMLLLTIPFTQLKRQPASRWNMIAGTSLALVSSIAVTFISLSKFGDMKYEFLLFFGYYCGLVTLCMWMTVYMIETMKENAAMREELQRAEKLQVLGELAASIAHEIRNPMTVTKGYIQLLRSRLSDATNLKYVHTALEALDQSESIISDYLLYSKPQAEKIEKINVKDKLLHIVNIMEPFVTSNGHDLIVQLDESMMIQAEPKKFSQAVVNFIKNAVEAMEQGGKLFIRAYTLENQVVIDIADTGIGMTEEQMLRLGNPFYSTKEKGTGLGLMVSYRIIAAMYGKVKVHSEKGKGTKFTIMIPCLME